METKRILGCVLAMACAMVIAAPAQAALITGTTIQSADVGANPNMNPLDAITGTGLPGGTPALTGTHDNSWSTNWWSNSATGQITIDLEGNYDLDTIHVWNYNEGGGGRGRGIKNGEIWVSPDENEANLVKLNTDGTGPHNNASGNFLLPQSTALNSYTGFDLDTSGITNASLLDNARLVRFKGIDTYGRTPNGLAEVQFGGNPAVAGPPPPPPSTVYEDAVLADNPFVYYRFEEQAGPTAIDTAGGDDNGTYGNNVTLAQPSAAPNLGNSGLIGSTNFGIDVPALGANYGQLSVELWVKSSGLGGLRSLYSTDHWTTNASGSSLHYNLNGNNVEHAVNNGNPNNVNTGNLIQVGQWYHIVTTYNQPNGDVETYVNGVNQNVGNHNNFNFINLTGGSQVGTWNGGRDVTGNMDEFALYASVLTPAQVSAHYAAATAPPRRPHPRADDHAGRRTGHQRPRRVHPKEKKGISGFVLRTTPSQGRRRVNMTTDPGPAGASCIGGAVLLRPRASGQRKLRSVRFFGVVQKGLIPGNTVAPSNAPLGLGK